MFIETLLSNPTYFFSVIALVGFSICVHEYAHAETAYRLGDDTAAQAGHLTLNPLVQMGPMSLLMLCLIGIAWGAVPVDERNFRKSSHGMWVSAAGPLSNVALCAVFAIISVIAYTLGADEKIVSMLNLGAVLNGALVILNLIPLPPLDGYRIFSEFIPPLRRLSPEVASQISLLLILLIFLTDIFQFVFFGGAVMAEFFSRIAEAVVSLF